MHEAFRWTTTDKVLLKQVNRHVKQLMAASINRHSSSVNWNGVLFVDHGVVVPSKKARTFAAAYAWWKREIGDPLQMAAPNLGKFEPVLTEPMQIDSAPSTGGPSALAASFDRWCLALAATASSPVASSPVQANHLPAFASLKLLRGILDDLCVVRVGVSSSPHVFKFTYVRTHVRTYVQIRSAVVISPLRTYVQKSALAWPRWAVFLQEGEAVGEGILRPGVRGHHDGWGQGRREGLQDGPRRSQGSSGGPTPKC